MIDEINWTDFVTSFFNVDRTWIEHVTRNWNFLRNEPGCNCSIFLDRPIYCLDYTQRKDWVERENLQICT